MAELNQNISYVTCGCGECFQELNVSEGVDENGSTIEVFSFDERRTAVLYYSHNLECELTENREEALLYYENNMKSLGAEIPSDIQEELDEIHSEKNVEETIDK